MKTFNYLFAILFAVLSSQYCFSATKNKLESMKNEISKKQTKIYELAAKIKSLESKLGSKNDTYLAKVKLAQAIDEELKLTKNQLSESENEAKVILDKTKLSLKKYIVEHFDDTSAESLIAQQTYKTLINKNINELKTNINNFSQSKKKIDYLTKRILKIQRDEDTIYKLITELEQQKKQASLAYVKETHSKEELEGKVSIIEQRQKKTKNKAQKTSKKIKEVAYKKQVHSFSLPLKKFVSSKKENKGIRFKPYSDSVVYSPGKGEVVYAGELSTYGNVVIVEHSKQVRTIILGDYQPLRKKGDLVEENAIIGQFKKSPKKLYFEVRKSNKSQEISHWLDESSRKIVL
jgi:murein DD-endopeptidase MepM/ murein hydrolase activator NlpD